ncbi:unnamed protein product [Medioppia subpectinata]|uniref:ABC transporter domain-containing protein n=1 Tax=Medioppia subpectinata TaxID=1979941 RepID=A0A7R9PVK0_9ACAR|nr:unnamed protein product [Medioppia subpectinata]CAG2101882.1 unnamed protein product [Medioppia subpectinata]
MSSNNIYGTNGINVNDQSFAVVWKDLSYRVKHRIIKEKTIINGISGYFRSGQITAILGPSGCGKSSLLNCLAGIKKKGVFGSISISTRKKLKIAVIGQEDHLDPRLTVREALNYASRLKNLENIDHKHNIEITIKRLDIESCADVRAKRCSGGQRKRVSIALELVSRPNILILDEPTSGLDVATTWQLINTLLDLTQQSQKGQPMAVVATIHQPSGKLFNLFHSVYIMSYDGQCIYQGTPQSMVNFMAQYGMKCPKFHNPSDYILEVASKEHGIGKPMLLASIMKIEALDLIAHPYKITPHFKYNTTSDIWTLSKRTFVLSYRDIWMLPLRSAAHLATVGLLVGFWGPESGKLSGCPDNFVVDGADFVKTFEEVGDKLNENFGCICFIVMFTWFGAIFAVLLTFPAEMHTFLKEYRNGWYSIYSYYMAKVLVDVFWQLTIPLLLIIPAFVGTGQYWETERWRFYYFIGICLLLALSSTSMGLIVSAYLMNSPTAAAFLGIITAFPLFLFSGFMIPVKDMPNGFRHSTWGNFVRFALEGTTTAIYGFNRCRSDPIGPKKAPIDWGSLITEQQMTAILASDHINADALMNTMSLFSGQVSDEAQSVIMTKMDYHDDDMYRAIAMLMLILVVLKVGTE